MKLGISATEFNVPQGQQSVRKKAHGLLMFNWLLKERIARLSDRKASGIAIVVVLPQAPALVMLSGLSRNIEHERDG